nr:set domain-containing protein 5 [Quercus suber]
MSESQLTRFRELSTGGIAFEPKMEAHLRSRISKNYQGEQLELAFNDEIKMQAIFHCNCVAMGTDSQWGNGVFALYSRINHSCAPNVHYDYNPSVRRGVVHAVKHIFAGEEILTSYIVITRNHGYRQRCLHNWRFECQCAACYGPEHNSHEVRRQRLMYIDETLAGLPEVRSVRMLGMSDQLVLEMAGDNISLLKQEGLVGIDLAMGALKYAHLEREVELYCLGPEKEYMMENEEYALAWIARIESMQRSSTASANSDHAEVN